MAQDQVEMSTRSQSQWSHPLSADDLDRRRSLEANLKRTFHPDLDHDQTGVKAYLFCVLFEDGTEISGCSSNVQLVIEKTRSDVGRAAQASDHTAVNILSADGTPKSCENLFGRGEGTGKSKSKFRELHPLVARLIAKMTDGGVPRSQAKEPSWWPEELAGKYACRTKELGISGCVAVLEAIFRRVRGRLQEIKELQTSLDCDFLANLTLATRLTLEAYFQWLEADARERPQSGHRSGASSTAGASSEVSRKRSLSREPSPIFPRSVRPRIAEELPQLLGDTEPLVAGAQREELRDTDIARVYSDLLAAGWDFDTIEAAVQTQSQPKGPDGGGSSPGAGHQLKTEPHYEGPCQSGSTLSQPSSLPSSPYSSAASPFSNPYLKCESVDSELSSDDVFRDGPWNVFTTDFMLSRPQTAAEFLGWGRMMPLVL